MDKSKPITVNDVVAWLTGVNMEDAYNALFERMKEISRQTVLAIEKLEKADKMGYGDPILGLLHAICDDDVEALSQLVSKYRLYKHNLSYFERKQVRQQLEREDILRIASSAVLIWLHTFSLNYSYYFSLPQEKREKIMVGIMSRECRRELLGEIADPRRKVPLEEIDYRLGVCDAEPEDTSLDMSKLGLDIDTLTPKEIGLLYDALNATNQGVKAGSKQGYSLQQYWGKDYTKNMKMLGRLKAKRQKT
jgi:hypothetical protein